MSVAGDEDDFHPQRFERERTVHVNGSPEEVYALLDPGKRHLWTGKKDTRECLFEGWGKTLSGAMYFSIDEHHGYRWEVMAEDDPENQLMRWILFMPGTELLVAELRCAESSQGGTDLTMVWSVIGLSPDGNQAVKEFFDTDSFEKQVDKTGERLNEYLD
jgi:hypothetical protein